MPTIPRANRRMNDMMRKERSGLEDYMYQGGEDTPPSEPPPASPSAAVIAVTPDDETTEPTPDNEMTEGEATTDLTVLDPGEEDPADMYVYAQGETPGTWTMYPPGVPCDSGTTRVALDHPATAADLAKMDEAVGSEEPVEPGYEAGLEGP